MWIEALRIALLTFGACLAVFLAFRGAVTGRLYGRAMVGGKYRAAGFWAFLAVGAGHAPKAQRLESPDRLG